MEAHLAALSCRAGLFKPDMSKNMQRMSDQCYENIHLFNAQNDIMALYEYIFLTSSMVQTIHRPQKG